MHVYLVICQSLYIHSHTIWSTKIWWALWRIKMIKNIEHQILSLTTPLKETAGTREQENKTRPNTQCNSSPVRYGSLGKSRKYKLQYEKWKFNMQLWIIQNYISKVTSSINRIFYSIWNHLFHAIHPQFFIFPKSNHTKIYLNSKAAKYSSTDIA